jgi:HlyD family secretion protein
MKRGCLIAAVAVIVILSIGLGVYFYQQSVKNPTTYETTKPEIGDVIKKTVATGSIKPRKEVQIKPQVSGVIDEIFVEEGQIVEKGDRIARVKLIPSEMNVNSAQSSVELARIRLDQAERELKRQKEIYNKNLDVESAKASFENAEQELERNKQLLEDGIISEQEYNRVYLDYQVAKTQFENAEISSQNQLKQFESDVDIRKQELAAAQNNLQLLREGVTSNSKQVSNVVVSTLSGMVLDIPVEEGSSVIERNNFNEGTSIAAIADMSNLVFEGKVDESEVGKLKEGMPIELTVGALEDVTIKAILEHIAPQGILEEGTVKFEILAAVTPTEDIFLRAGYSASGDIILERKDSVLTIQERDLIIDEDTDSTFVEVAVGEQDFERRYVRTGLSDGIAIEILGGLDTATAIKVIQD